MVWPTLAPIARVRLSTILSICLRYHQSGKYKLAEPRDEKEWDSQSLYKLLV